MGCRLSFYGGVGPDVEIGFQRYHSGHIEDYYFLCTASYSLAKRAWTVVIEICHMDNLASTASADVAAVTFGSRKGRYLCRCSCGNGTEG